MPASKGPRGSSKKAKKTGSNVFDMFSQTQLAEFKDGFQIMDRDRDGFIGKQDLRAIFDEVGRLATDGELDDMLKEGENNVNFTTLLHMFASRSSGEIDEDDVIEKAFRAFEKEPGEINSEDLRHMLMSFGDKFTAQEVDDAFDVMDLDEDTGIIDSDSLVSMLTAKSE
ncbi:unnamed protein product [Meganyctiphanes norvegica]|uniref:EF-hand domain-containing protein n=1 Tax=Meganyctiphanes norvegica TaxID=48144 RepID=A0AAV2SE81_MEGNR